MSFFDFQNGTIVRPSRLLTTLRNDFHREREGTQSKCGYDCHDFSHGFFCFTLFWRAHPIRITDQSPSFSGATCRDDVPTHAALSDVFRAPTVLYPNRKTLPARAERSLPHGWNCPTGILSSCRNLGKFRATNAPPVFPSSLSSSDGQSVLTTTATFLHS